MRPFVPKCRRVVALLAITLGIPACAQAGKTTEPVTLTETADAFVLHNAFLTATISKTSGDLVSLRYAHLELMGYVSGHHGGYWEQNPSGAARLETRRTLDPAANGGERAEVAIKGWSDGQSLTSHPRPDSAATASEDPASQLSGRSIGPPPNSDRPRNAGTALGGRGAQRGRGPGLLVDEEIRYALGRNDHGLYTYAIFSHQPTYAATQIGESRYGLKLNGTVFDWLSIDAQRNEKMPTGADWDAGLETNMKEARRMVSGVHQGTVEHKYDYCADQFATPAYGWASTTRHVGLYVVNPSMEYLSDGPDHFELTGHIDDGDGGDPTLLDYWRGSHYGGSLLPIASGEAWSKVVGPILLYLNTGSTPDAMFQDAKRQAVEEAGKWPYPWVRHPDYPLGPERGQVSGQLELQDAQAPGTALPHLLVGLAAPDGQSVSQDAGQNGPPPLPMTWQNDAKHYQFWVHGTHDGHFSIPEVRPGTYELVALADGVLGEFRKTGVVVSPGGRVDLGVMPWVPVRYGRQLWQIGVPNRSAAEFKLGGDHWHWGLYLAYAKLFPHDVDYTVGKSDWTQDWFIYQVPHVLQEDATGRSPGRATPWTIHFTLPATQPLRGEAVLRVALDGVGTRSLAVQVNGKDAGAITGLVYNATINRDGIEGSWVEKDLRFDAGMLQPGENSLTITVPAGSATSGVSYDVLRLELANTPAQTAH